MPSASASSSPRSPHAPLLALQNDSPSLPSHTARQAHQTHSRSSTMDRIDQLMKQARWASGNKFHGLGTKRAVIIFLVCSTALILTASSFWVPTPQLSIPVSTASKQVPQPVSDIKYDLEPPPRIPPDHLNPLPRESTLQERLAALRNAPGLGWEQSDFIRWNLETCSDFTKNQNKDLLLKSNLIWATMNSTMIYEVRERMAGFLEQHLDRGSFDIVPVRQGGRGLAGEGRGIVFTAGNADTLSRVVLTLKYLRQKLNCDLPAAIYHFPSEKPPEDSPLVAELEGLNAKLVEAVGTVRDSSRTKNYHLKAMAIVECEWAEVIYLDSDNIPAADPALLFDAPNYQRLGAMFWPDYWKTSPVNPIWQIIGVQCRDEWEQEAGQIIIDKRRHLDAMLLSLYMLLDWKFWYYFSDGDKDVFRFAFLALRKRWALPGRWVGGGALPSNSATGFCAHTMEQYDHTGEPMFVHYNLLKQIPSGIWQGFTWGRTKQVKGYPGPMIEPGPYAHHPEISPNRSSYIDPTVRGPDDVEADMLANADDDGNCIQPAEPEVRRRAILEKGIRVFFHGGQWSALCIDFDWSDPHPNRDWTPDGSNELGIDWKGNPLEIVFWGDDARLGHLESDVYGLGFVPGAPGF
ncbi:glycosyltransferase family 71 protein [Calocera cornea HHB12733]|uniref:Glycosyltransferase family 71 protein n=1 Tax=Calocera cornea HHB12733 TaxID=1353952 RepID=A0A165K812_9BASI|nr:glycosyltransferase family 71 protein [Calocera cornea HHB12733]